jgi:beta-glucanase (GH16 family)
MQSPKRRVCVMCVNQLTNSSLSSGGGGGGGSSSSSSSSSSSTSSSSSNRFTLTRHEAQRGSSGIALFFL